MVIRTVVTISMLLIFQNISAQFIKNTENSQFDFWIGKWDLYTSDGLFGESEVDTVLEGYAIRENFVEFPPDPFHSISFTTYNTDTKQWEQTMVDNKGHHFLFTGGFNNETITLLRKFLNKKGEERIHRTRYYNISESKFDWTYDASSDGGKTWNVFYTVHYKRKK